MVETISDILQGLMPAVEAVQWLHVAVADVVEKLNEHAPESICFSTSMDGNGSLSIICTPQAEPATDDGEQQWGFAPSVPYISMPPMPMMVMNSSHVSIGRFTHDEVGVVFVCDEQQFNRRGQQLSQRVADAGDVERVVAISLRSHWDELFGMVSHAVYGGLYESSGAMDQPMMVEEIDLSYDDQPDAGDLGYLVLEPRPSEW